MKDIERLTSMSGELAHLSEEGQHHVRALIREEKKARREEWIWWIPPTVAVVGAIIAMVSLHQAIRQRIKAEEVYELTQALSIDAAKMMALSASFTGFREYPFRDDRMRFYETTLLRAEQILGRSGVEPDSIPEIRDLRGIIAWHNSNKDGTLETRIRSKELSDLAEGN